MTDGTMLSDVDIYDTDRPNCKRHTLYCGTMVVGTQRRNSHVLAVVVKTGQSM